MNSSHLSRSRAYRILACLAVFHGAALISGFYVDTTADGWMKRFHRLWVGLATLWFFWPIVLALHPGASKRWAYASTGLAAVFMLCWFTLYARILAPPVFGVPTMLSLSPYDLGGYAFWYGRGRVNGIRDAREGRYRLEAYGFGTFTPGAPPLSGGTLKQHGIEIDHVAGCVVDVRLMGHAKGYNDAMVDRMRRSLGDNVVPAAERAEAKRQSDYVAAMDAGRADARDELRAGRAAAFEVTGPPAEGEEEYRQMLKERFGIELRRTSTAPPDRNGEIALGHAAGYNDVMWREVEQRAGQQPLDAFTAVNSGQSYSDFIAEQNAP